VRQLNLGGAQRQLLELVRSLDPARFRPTVMALYPGGEFASEIAGLPGVGYVCLGKRGRWDLAGVLVRLVREMLRVRPRVVQGYVGVCNLLALLVKMVMPSTRVVWSIRNGQVDPSDRDWLVRWSFRLERALSSCPDLIIANSEAGKAFCASHGFPAPKIRVISNGIDTERFRPEPERGARIRALWGLAEAEKAIGIAGRLHPEKDHATFLRAAALIVNRRPEARFVVIGDGPAEYCGELRRLAAELGIESRVIWAGRMDDMPAVYSALDILTSSSATEGFSNVLCEAMACAVPCVATDVGDSAWIVGDTGAVVPPGDARTLAETWNRLLGRPNEELAGLGRRARLRIESHCRRELLVEQTESVLDSLL